MAEITGWVRRGNGTYSMPMPASAQTPPVNTPQVPTYQNPVASSVPMQQQKIVQK